MSWKDKYRSASFRGIPFKVERSSIEVGRRNQMHVFPYKDEIAIEDFGLDPDNFVIEGYVIQNTDNNFDYFTERNSLINALKKEGPGTLIHPYLGVKKVQLIERARVSESIREGGIARFSMKFVLFEDKESVAISAVDPVTSCDTTAIKSTNDIKDGFGSIYDSTGAPDFSSSAVLIAVESFNNMLRAVTQSIQAAGPAKIANAISILTETYTDITSTMITNTCSFGNSLVNMGNGLLSLSNLYGDIVTDQLYGPCSSMVRGISSGPFSGAKTEQTNSDSNISSPNTLEHDFGVSLVNSVLAINDFGKSPGESDKSSYGGTVEDVAITTISRAQQSANLNTIINIARCNALIIAVRNAIRINYKSHNDVVTIRNNVINIMNDVLLKLGDESVNTDYATFNVSISDSYSYNAIVDLKSTFTESMDILAGPLAKVITYQVGVGAITSLELAYDQYQDLDREQEIIERNRLIIPHPGFLPNGQEIEILNV